MGHVKFSAYVDRWRPPAIGVQPSVSLHDTHDRADKHTHKHTHHHRSPDRNPTPTLIPKTRTNHKDPTGQNTIKTPTANFSFARASSACKACTSLSVRISPPPPAPPPCSPTLLLSRPLVPGVAVPLAPLLAPCAPPCPPPPGEVASGTSGAVIAADTGALACRVRSHNQNDIQSTGRGQRARPGRALSSKLSPGIQTCAKFEEPAREGPSQSRPP